MLLRSSFDIENYLENNQHLRQNVFPFSLLIKNAGKSQTASVFFEFSTLSTPLITTAITTIIYPSFFISLA